MDLFGQRYREWLAPYVEGTLDARRRAKLEARMAHDPGLAAEAEAERRVSARLRETARGAGDPAGQHSLWPSILARLEPRRPSVRPFVLVGGLSAATAALIGATLWGPLKPSTPASPPTQVASSGAGGGPGLAPVAPPSGKPHRHPGRRHPVGGLGKRPAAVYLSPRPASDGEHEEAPPQDRLASGQSDVPQGAAAGDGPTAPKFTKSSGNFRLTTNEHPGRSATDSGLEPTPDTSPGNSDAAPDSAPTTDAPAADAKRTGADTNPPTAAPPDGAAKAATAHHRRRHHRRHGHAAHSPAASATRPDSSAPASADAPPSAHAAPASPKSGVKPVD